MPAFALLDQSKVYVRYKMLGQNKIEPQIVSIVETI